MFYKKNIFFIYSLIVVLTSGCLDESYREIKRERADRANKNNGEILIGISWSKQYDTFIKGVQLAVKEINNEGGILNRPLKIIINTEEEKLSDPGLSTRKYQNISLNIANSFAKNHDIIAVIGHLASKTALLAAPVYENTGILFLSPSATDIQLTNHSFDYIFRTIPDNYEMGAQIADYAIKRSYKKIAVLYDRVIYASQLTDVFSEKINEIEGDMKIVFMRSFFENSVDLTALLVDLKKVDFDIIFLATTDINLTARIYQKSHEMGINVPFIGGENLDNPVFFNLVKKWEYSETDKKTVIPVVFNNFLPENQKFIASFKQEYGNDIEPDQFAALGYDNIILLAHAIKQAHSSVPIKIAETLRYMAPCQALTGKYLFTESGELMSKPFYFKSVYQDKFRFEQIDNIPSVTSIETCNDIGNDKDGISNGSGIK